MDSAQVDAPIERMSSIEKEPRTLNLQQIQIAREAALYVVSTRSVEEALQIFTEGLEPVMSCAEEKRGSKMDFDEEAAPASPSKELGIVGLRDIVSAPF